MRKGLSQAAKAPRPYPMTTGPQSVNAVPSRVYGHGLQEDAYGRIWEDLLQDEKIEKLMQLTTRLWVRNQHLERDLQQLRNHKHNEYGNPIIEKSIGGPEIEDSYPKIDYNPFNSKEIEESEERMY